MPEDDPTDQHEFDQTNGVLGPVAEERSSSSESERDRRRRLSIAQGLGYINTGHN